MCNSGARALRDRICKEKTNKWFGLTVGLRYLSSVVVFSISYDASHACGLYRLRGQIFRLVSRVDIKRGRGVKRMGC
jgi:hypothetical protein